MGKYENDELIHFKSDSNEKSEIGKLVYFQSNSTMEDIDYRSICGMHTLTFNHKQVQRVGHCRTILVP